VRSFITSVLDGATVKAGQQTVLRGIAFDGGTGIKSVAVSTDGGKSWTDAKLGQDLGKYSFREWTLPVTLARRLCAESAGHPAMVARRTHRPAVNPAGYLRNVVETTRVTQWREDPDHEPFDAPCHHRLRHERGAGCRQRQALHLHFPRTSGLQARSQPRGGAGQCGSWSSSIRADPAAGPKFQEDFWEAEVTKMIKVYGAPIDDKDVPKIVEYLTATY